MQLDLPWDAAITPDGDILFTEICQGLTIFTRETGLTKLLDNSTVGLTPDFFCASDLAGMTGLVLDPDFGVQGSPHIRDVYVAMLSNKNTERSNTRIVRITLALNITDPPVRRVDVMEGIMFKHVASELPEGSGLTSIRDPGQMSSCRLRFGLRGTQFENILFVASGDNHNATVPQDLWALGGKIFAIDRDGNSFSGNIVGPPLGDSRIFAYGLRNPQGIAMRPGTEQIFIAEHGPTYSDEVTMIRGGTNGGWDPKDRADLVCEMDGTYCGYNGDPQTMPMTDFERFPDAAPPVWNNNQRSAGMSPCIFLEGSQWGRYEGWLAVGIMGPIEDWEVQGDQSIVFLEISEQGEFMSVRYNPMIPHGRYRSLQMAPSGNLLIVETNRVGRTLPYGRSNIRELTPEDFEITSQSTLTTSNNHDTALGPVFITVGVALSAVILLAVVLGAVHRRVFRALESNTTLVQAIVPSKTEDGSSFELLSLPVNPPLQERRDGKKHHPDTKNRQYTQIVSV
jgi:glucose/arabinose dehydrogenase